MENTNYTKNIIAAIDGLKEELRKVYTYKDFGDKIEELKNAGDKSNRPSILKDLYEMLDSYGISYEKGKDNSYYEAIFKRMDSLDDENRKNRINVFELIENKMMVALFSIYKEYPSPEDYMLRLVNRLSEKEDHWENDTLRVRILKQFIKYGDYLKAADYNGKGAITKYIKRKLQKKNNEPIDKGDVLEYLDDDIFLLLDNATKDQKKPDGTYGILKLADDLATGKFRVEGVTKKGLYLFAIVYNMTYYSGDVEHGERLDPRTDIENNLFRDYYANNFIRFMTESYKNKLDFYELDPSGQGINYKNYAEMVFLYYIASSLTPEEKIKKACSMIKELSGESNNKENKIYVGTDRTMYYRDLIRDDVENNRIVTKAFEMNENAFKEFIKLNYDCDNSYVSDKGNRIVISPIQKDNSQTTAFNEYIKIIKQIEELGETIETCDFGLWFADINDFRQNGFERMKTLCPEITEKEFDDFTSLLAEANRYVKDFFKQERTPQNITRTALLTAYYYYFISLGSYNDSWTSFGDIYEEFENGINESLILSYYQRFSNKNIIDILIAFSCCAVLNNS